MAADDIFLPFVGGPALRVEQVPISHLRPTPRYAGGHSREQTKQLADVIRKFGFFNPVIVDADRVTLTGHARVEAARLAGLIEVPTIRLDHLAPTQGLTYLVADKLTTEQTGLYPRLLALGNKTSFLSYCRPTPLIFSIRRSTPATLTCS